MVVVTLELVLIVLLDDESYFLVGHNILLITD
jgi:hypothetical protein